jgi:hypothetical protein
MKSLSAAEYPRHSLWLRVTNPLTLRTEASPPIRNLEALMLADPQDEEEAEDDDTLSPDMTSRLAACFKAHRRTTRLLLKHARIQRKIKYGQTLLRMFVKKPKVALQTILRTSVAAAADHSQPLPTKIAIIRDETTGRLLVEPEEVIEQVRKLETKALSPDPTLLRYTTRCINYGPHA